MKKRGATIKHKVAAHSRMIVHHVLPTYEMGLKNAAHLFRIGEAGPAQYDDLVDTMDMMRLGIAVYPAQKRDETAEAVAEMSVTTLSAIRARWVETEKISATEDEQQVLDALVTVSFDYWNRRSSALYTEARRQLIEVRKKQHQDYLKETEMNARDNALPLPAIDGIINAAHKALAESKAPLCSEDVAKAINGTKRATKPQIKEAEKQLKELYGLGILESNARTGGVSFYSLIVAPALEAITGIPVVEDDGCGACGDACASNGGDCRVKEESPPVPSDAKQDQAIYEGMIGRFLGWKLPGDFSPDGGIHFAPSAGVIPSGPHWPIGTNLLTADQAEQMFRHCVSAAEVCDLVQTGGESQTSALDMAGDAAAELGAKLADRNQEVNSLLGIIADIRAAIGDPEGKIMLGELAAHIQRDIGELIESLGVEKRVSGSAISAVAHICEHLGCDDHNGHVPALRAIDALRAQIASLNAENVALKTLDDAMPGFGAEYQAQQITSLTTDVTNTRRALSDALNEANRMRTELAIERQARQALQEQINASPAPVALGFVLTTPKRAMRSFGKEAAAQSAAMAAARAGKTGEVFALIPVGRAVRGAEWRAAEGAAK